MQNSLFTPKIKKILGRPKGIKVALFDQRSYTVLSTCIPHTYLLNNDYFLLTMIEDKTRTKMPQISCSVFVSSEGLLNIFHELKDPYYGSYNIYFLNAVNDESLSELAKADKKCVVKEVFEIYIDVHQIDNNLFVINDKNTNISDVRRIDSIVSLFNMLEIMPVICSTNDYKDFAHDLNVKLKKYDQKQQGNLIIFDRKIDMVTPLLFNWHYQSMIYDYTNYSLGLVTVGKKTFQLFNDEIFQKTKFTDISNLKHQIINSKEEKRKQIDFENIFSSNILTEKNNDLVETHLILHNTITSLSIKNGNLSDLEYSLLQDKKYFKTNLEKIHSTLKDKEIPFENRLKFFLLNLINLLDLEVNKERLISNWFIKKYPEFIEAFYKFVDFYKPKKLPVYSFSKDKDYKLGYVPPIIKVIKNISNQQNKNYIFTGGSYRKNERMIVYFKGGVTFHEYQMIQQHFPNTIVIGDHIIGYNDILKQILKDK